ncbi:solute carrier organic anion transporter family member 1A5 [Cephus cinctus]|uniref:Solute carrier organic anion transporter family member 1A5 n=1 Tax=Cephus cinctus TaxID=211228 RepID=A0AAJ7CGI0_CEPCN|nr:solute carrier organic anion transporter family member 1A5 [Cephus cinctus]XP_015609201.1 solute carrier organic anion transporter family member 1A5 [Cephus cinctus]
MSIGPQEVVRSEVEGGLSGPANPIPNKSMDCGCAQLRCPKLAKFATRSFFVTLLFWIGLIQAAAQAYLYLTGPTLARRFQIDPYLIDWILVVSEITPFVVGVTVAYWGDRIHRAAWTGALVLIQCAGFLSMIIPHLTHHVRIIEETENVTHMSLYSEDSPELCYVEFPRIVIEKSDTCYFTLGLLILIQFLSGMASVAFYALGISYLDDNTRKSRVAGFIGLVLSSRIFGYLLGLLLAWLCLRIDAENFNIIESSQEQIGAWWLGWPILAFALAIPGIFLSIFPRRLISEVVDSAAASILDMAGQSRRSSQKSLNTKVGSTSFLPSILRLMTNNIVICNILGAMFCLTAIMNFMMFENIFLESRFYLPRPNGILLGFGDPWTSRMVTTMIKPILIGIVVIVSGFIISGKKPGPRYLAGYNVMVTIVASTLIFALAYATCNKPSIVGERKGSIYLLKYCNKNCHCSREADFRPVCDSNGKFTFYSACHAGCTVSSYVNNEKVYGGCSCVEEMTGLGNTQASDGPCNSSSCRIGLIVYQVGTILAYTLVASSMVGHLLINLRSVYVQDKALMIGFWMTWVAIVVFVPGRLLYHKIAALTCKHWGSQGALCHLHDTKTFGDYMCYLTAFLLSVGAIFQILVWYWSRKLRLYSNSLGERENSEMKELSSTQTVPLLDPVAGPSGSKSSDTVNHIDEEQEDNSEPTQEPAAQEAENPPDSSNQPLKYGPLGPGDRRNETSLPLKSLSVVEEKNVESADELDSSSDEGNEEKNSSPKIAYKPLELDSDVESDLSSVGPRSRRRVKSKEFDPVLNNVGIASFPVTGKAFPNPDDYGNPRSSPKPNSLLSSDSLSPVHEGPPESDIRNQDGFSLTNSFEYTRKKKPNGLLKNSEPYRLTGDFNEVGIPIAESPTNSPEPTVEIQSIQITMPVYGASQDDLNVARSSIESLGGNVSYHLEDVVAEPEVPALPVRPPSRGQTSSGFGSLPDVEGTGTPLPLSPSSILKSQESLNSGSSRDRPPPLNTDF